MHFEINPADIQELSELSRRINLNAKTTGAGSIVQSLLKWQ